MRNFLARLTSLGLVTGALTFFTFGLQSVMFTVIFSSIMSLVVTSLNALAYIDEKSIPARKESDDSPQARFARDEITQLELEQEIDRQLKAGLDGDSRMNKEHKQIMDLDYYETLA